MASSSHQVTSNQAVFYPNCVDMFGKFSQLPVQVVFPSLGRVPVASEAEFPHFVSGAPSCEHAALYPFMHNLAYTFEGLIGPGPRSMSDLDCHQWAYGRLPIGRATPQKQG